MLSCRAHGYKCLTLSSVSAAERWGVCQKLIRQILDVGTSLNQKGQVNKRTQYVWHFPCTRQSLEIHATKQAKLKEEK